MQRRNFSSASVCTLVFAALGAPLARALTLGNLSNAEASQGLKAALEQGAASAVSLLGRPGGFLDNPKVRIPLPGYLDDAAKMLRMVGQGQRLDELTVAMNRAAEQAVPLAKDMLVGAARSMSVTDAKNILAGGDTSVTNFFAEKTRAPLFQRFLPIAEKATENVGAASMYNQIAGKIAGFGPDQAKSVRIEDYVANKSLDGLYLMIGDEEKKLRQDPLGASSDIVRKVFGALK